MNQVGILKWKKSNQRVRIRCRWPVWKVWDSFLNSLEFLCDSDEKNFQNAHMSPNLQCWWEKNWVCKYPCCLSQGIFVEKKFTKGVLMVILSTCKQVGMLFISWLQLVQKRRWWQMTGYSKPKVTHSGQQVWGDSPASLQSPAWPPHLVIFWGAKKMWLIGWNHPVHLLQPQIHELLWRIKAFGGHLPLMAPPRRAVGGRHGGSPVPPLPEVGCSGCFTLRNVNVTNQGSSFLFLLRPFNVSKVEGNARTAGSWVFWFFHQWRGGWMRICPPEARRGTQGVKGSTAPRRAWGDFCSETTHSRMVPRNCPTLGLLLQN